MLSESHIKLLELIPGWTWHKFRGKYFSKGLNELKTYLAENKHVKINKKYETESGYKLGLWISLRLKELDKNTLNSNLKETLNEADPSHPSRSLLQAIQNDFIVLAPEESVTATNKRKPKKKNNRGKELDEELQKFIEKYGHSHIPRIPVYNSLYGHVYFLRRSYLKNKLCIETIDKWNHIEGWSWTVKEAEFDKGLMTFKQLLEKNPYIDKIYFYKWIQKRKKEYENGNFPKEYEAKLKEHSNPSYPYDSSRTLWDAFLPYLSLSRKEKLEEGWMKDYTDVSPSKKPDHLKTLKRAHDDCLDQGSYETTHRKKVKISQGEAFLKSSV